MNRNRDLIFIACFVAWLLVSTSVVEADTPTFSGSFALSGSKGAFKFKKDEVWTLQVSQTGAAIDVKKLKDGHQVSMYSCPLDGSNGKYSSEKGAAGKCRAHIKGKALLLETLVATQSQSGGPTVQIHTRERWELSSDLKTLTIKCDVDFPGSPVNGFQLVEPWTEIYTRN